MFIENPKPGLFMTFELDLTTMLYTKGLTLDSIEIHEESGKSLFFFSDFGAAQELTRRIKYGDGVNGNFSEVYRNKKLILSMVREERGDVQSPPNSQPKPDICR